MPDDQLEPLVKDTFLRFDPVRSLEFRVCALSRLRSLEFRVQDLAFTLSGCQGFKL